MKVMICVVAAMTVIGCQQHVAVPRGQVQEMPGVSVDEAMQIRDWDQSVAYYHNPRFIAGPTGFWFTPAYDQPDYVYPLIETPMFVGQTLALPVTLAINPAWNPVEYAGETIGPTHHAMPALPPPVPEGIETALQEEPVIERPGLPPVEPPGEMTPAPMEPLPDFAEPSDEPPPADVLPADQPPPAQMQPPRRQRPRDRDRSPQAPPAPTRQPVVRPPDPPSSDVPTTQPVTPPPPDTNK